MRLPLLPIVLGLHLRQSGDGSIEGEQLLLAGENRRRQRILLSGLDSQIVDQHAILLQLFLLRDFFRLKKIPVGSGSGRHHSNLVIVQRIDQRDESPRFRLGLHVQNGNVADKDGVKHLRDLQVVVGPQRPTTNLREGTIQDEPASLPKRYVTAFDPYSPRPRRIRLLGRHELEHSVQQLVGISILAVHKVEFIRSGQSLPSIIQPGIERDDVGARLEEVDEGEKLDLCSPFL